jgi:hypothetical protein
MRTVVLAGVSAVAGVVLACGGGGTASADVALGPGPTNYTVEPQAAPGSYHYQTAANSQTLPDPSCTPGAVNPKVTPSYPTLGVACGATRRRRHVS